MLDIGGIGLQKKEYKDHDKVNFLSLEEYLTMAKKIISKMSSGPYRKFLNTEDVISYIANALMMADWRWDENYSSSEGRKKGLYSYRNQCAIWAIQTLITKHKKSKKNNISMYSLDDNINGEDIRNALDFIEDPKGENPSSIIEKQEVKQDIKNLVSNLLDSDLLTDRNKDYIKMYFFEGETLEVIGKRFNITREAVRQGIHKSLEKIRNVTNV
jgi:RNA polymerase sigma factor (sigma-70 family)